MRIFCKQCGEIDYGLYDGYGVADTLLEGVMFEVRAKNKIKVTVQDSYKDYFKNNHISISKWCKEVKECVMDEEVMCPFCKQDAYIEE